MCFYWRRKQTIPCGFLCKIFSYSTKCKNRILTIAVMHSFMQVGAMKVLLSFSSQVRRVLHWPATTPRWSIPNHLQRTFSYLCEEACMCPSHTSGGLNFTQETHVYVQTIVTVKYTKLKTIYPDLHASSNATASRHISQEDPLHPLSGSVSL